MCLCYRWWTKYLAAQYTKSVLGKMECSVLHWITLALFSGKIVALWSQNRHLTWITCLEITLPNCLGGKLSWIYLYVHKVMQKYVSGREVSSCIMTGYTYKHMWCPKHWTVKIEKENTQSWYCWHEMEFAITWSCRDRWIDRERWCSPRGRL